MNLLGVNPSRPVPAAVPRVAVDYDAWHIRLVVYEEIVRMVRAEDASGSLDIPSPCKRMSKPRKPGEPTRDTRTIERALDRGRRILVDARVVTAPCAKELTSEEVRTLLLDLQRRVKARRDLGIDDSGPSRDE